MTSIWTGSRLKPEREGITVIDYIVDVADYNKYIEKENCNKVQSRKEGLYEFQ